MVRASRIYSSRQRLAEYLNLPDVAALQKFMDGPTCKRPWLEYAQSYLDNIQPPRPKGAELTQVLAEIIEGEKLGRCRYSRVISDKKGWKQLQHAAKFLRDTFHYNTKYQEGLFYGSDLSDDEIMKRLWQVFLRLSDRTNPKRGTRESGTEKHGRDSSSDTEEEEFEQPGPVLSKVGGKAQIQSKEDEFAEQEIVLTRLNKMSFSDLQQRITRSFNLGVEKLLFRIESEQGLPNGSKEITEGNWDQYIDVVVGMAGEDNLWFQTVPRFVGEGIGSNEIAEGRVLHPWHTMILEREYNTPDLRDRYWQYILLSKIGADINVEQIHGEWERLEIGGDAQKEWERTLIEFTDEANDDESRVPVTKFPEITDDEERRVAQQEQLLNNIRYQRENEEEAYKLLEITNPLCLRMPGMSNATTFKFWQPLAVLALYKMLESVFRAGMLCDGMGLGKTIEFLALVQLYWNIRKKRLAEGKQVERAAPTLVIAPHTILRQWQTKVNAFFPELKSYIYHTTSKDIQGKLTKQHELFDGTEPRAACIILTAPKTWQERHDKRARGTEHDLSKCFGLVAVDEAHDMGGTREIDAIKQLRAPRRVALTATPIGTKVEAFSNLLSWLQPYQWIDRNWGDLAYTLFDHSFPADANPFDVLTTPDERYLLCTPGVTEEFIFKADLEDLEKGRLLGEVFESIVICRTQASRIPFIDGRLLGDAIPPVKTTHVVVKYSAQEQIFLESLHAKIKLAKFDAKVKKLTLNSKDYRRLSSLDSSLLFFFLNYMMAKDCIAFRRSGKSILHLLQNISRRMKERRVDSFEIPDKDQIEKIMQICTQGSPKFRWLCILIADLVVLRQEKLIIFVAHPLQQLFLEKALQAVGLKAFAWAAGVDEKTRHEYQQKFNNDPYGSLDILVNNYMTGCAGLDFQNRCHNMVYFDEPPTLMHGQQAIGRIQRTGQTSKMRLFKLFLEGSSSKGRVDLIMRSSKVGMMTMMSHLLNGEEVELSVGLHFFKTPDGVLHVIIEGEKEWVERGLSPWPEDPVAQAEMLTAFVLGSQENVVQAQSSSAFEYGMPYFGTID